MALQSSGPDAVEVVPGQPVADHRGAVDAVLRRRDLPVVYLTAYADEFGAFLESATEGGLTTDAVAEAQGVWAARETGTREG